MTSEEMIEKYRAEHLENDWREPLSVSFRPIWMDNLGKNNKLKVAALISGPIILGLILLGLRRR